jgi:ABC-2 type transport system permease protein
MRRKLQRIKGAFMRQFYVTLHSPFRLFEMFFWPFVDVVLWGFLTVYLRSLSPELAKPAAFLLGALLLWDIMFRGKLAIAISFLEESWNRNVVNVLATPLTPGEYLVGATTFGFVKVGLGWAAIAMVAWLAYSFDVTSLGISLLPFAASLAMTALVLGLMTLVLILWLGKGAEVLAWGLAFLLMPISAVFYPVAVLPRPLAIAARFWAASYIFEGMREVLSSGTVRWDWITISFALNLGYLAAMLVAAKVSLEAFARKGFISRYL